MSDQPSAAEQSVADVLNRTVEDLPTVNARIARRLIAAVRPLFWREVAQWVRDTCEEYDGDRVCENCAAQASLIDWHARDLESGAVEPPVHDGTHHYLSTGCFHNDHKYCQSMTGLNGAKRPGRCKFCDASCQCRCHEGGTDD